jgi:Restriction endonuclease
MLTDIDTHYLVGLLSSIAAADAIEVELGSRVVDSIANTERDVDITIAYPNGDSRTRILAGIEVKAHTRPLDVAHVEQLAAKLNDMPTLDVRSIVSASGFTDPARRKAEARGIDLFNLRPWNFKTQLLDSVNLHETFQFHMRALEWAAPPRVSFETQPEVPLAATVGYTTTAAIKTAEGFISLSTLGAVAENVQRQILDVLKSSSVIMSLPDGRTAAGQRQTAVLTDRPTIEVDGRHYEVGRAVVTGDVRWAAVSPPNFFMLARDGEERPHVACVVGEIPGGHLVGLALNNQGQASVISLPVTERNRKKIFRQKLREEGSSDR